MNWSTEKSEIKHLRFLIEPPKKICRKSDFCFWDNSRGVYSNVTQNRWNARERKKSSKIKSNESCSIENKFEHIVDHRFHQMKTLRANFVHPFEILFTPTFDRVYHAENAYDRHIDREKERACVHVRLKRWNRARKFWEFFAKWIFMIIFLLKEKNIFCYDFS